MESMVERVGAELRKECLEVFGATWSNDVAWRFARAAITAMREPTPEMEKGLQAYLDHLTAYDEPSCSTAYHCMIDAALKEQEKVG
jgi:hypothetical protein